MKATNPTLGENIMVFPVMSDVAGATVTGWRIGEMDEGQFVPFEGGWVTTQSLFDDVVDGVLGDFNQWTKTPKDTTKEWIEAITTGILRLTPQGQIVAINKGLYDEASTVDVETWENMAFWAQLATPQGQIVAANKGLYEGVFVTPPPESREKQSFDWLTNTGGN